MENATLVVYEGIIVGSIYTNQSHTVDQALELISFDEDTFISESGFDDIDYNDFEIRSTKDFSRFTAQKKTDNGSWQDIHSYNNYTFASQKSAGYERDYGYKVRVIVD